MKKFKLLPMTLRLFDGGAAGAAAGAGGDGAGEVGAQGGTQQKVPGTTRRGKTGEYDNVIFGKRPDDNGTPAAGEKKTTEVSTTSNTLDERKAAFNKFIDENKDLDTERQQALFDRRFKDYKTLQESNAKNQPVIDMLMQRYHVEDGNLDKLMEAMENDDSYWNQAAEEAGMPVEQFKQFSKLQRENQQLMQREKARLGQDRAEQQLQAWTMEADALKAKIPGFDLRAEVQNPQFISLLKNNIPMETAYNVVHMDDIMNSVAANASAQAEKRVVDNVRAKGNRPAENGTAAQSGFVYKDDVSKLTKKDRMEVARRAARGEKITFGNY